MAEVNPENKQLLSKFNLPEFQLIVVVLTVPLHWCCLLHLPLWQLCPKILHFSHSSLRCGLPFL